MATLCDGLGWHFVAGGSSDFAGSMANFAGCFADFANWFLHFVGGDLDSAGDIPERRISSAYDQRLPRTDRHRNLYDVLLKSVCASFGVCGSGAYVDVYCHHRLKCRPPRYRIGPVFRHDGQHRCPCSRNYHHYGSGDYLIVLACVVVHAASLFVQLSAPESFLRRLESRLDSESRAQLRNRGD